MVILNDNYTKKFEETKAYIGICPKCTSKISFKKEEIIEEVNVNPYVECPLCGANIYVKNCNAIDEKGNYVFND